MDLLRESQLALIVSPLEQLLQGINPRTKKADNVVNIARYVPFVAIEIDLLALISACHWIAGVSFFFSFHCFIFILPSVLHLILLYNCFSSS